MDILTLVVVGLIAGVLASFLVRGAGYGIVGNIVAGIGGAILGSYIFVRAGWHAPWPGLPGTIVVATIGAAILLLVLQLINSRSRRRL